MKQTIRQNEDEKELKDVLLSLRTYNLTRDHGKWLQRYQWHNLKEKYGDELLKRMDRDGLSVFPTHADEWQHNKANILQLNAQVPIAKVKTTNNGFHAQRNPTDSGLLTTLYFCKGAKVHLTSNLDVDWGLYNGAAGEVEEILYSPGDCPGGATLPQVVYVHFPKYSGPPFNTTRPLLVPITPVTRRLDCGCCRRKQVPLRLGWGTTLHRCQGMTIGKHEVNRYIVIHPGTRKFES